MPLIPSHILLQTYSLTLALTSYLLLTSPASILSSTSLQILGEAMHIPPARFSPDTHVPASASTSLFTKPTTIPRSTRELLALIAFILFIAAITQSLLSTPLRYSLDELKKLARESLGSSSIGRFKSQAEKDDRTSVFAEKLFYLHSTQTLFLSLSGVRVLLEGILVAYIYLGHADRSLGMGMLGEGMGKVTTRINNDELGVVGSALGLLANRVLFTVVMADMLFWGYLWTVLREEGRDLASVLAQRRKLAEENE